jgi:broad specificity phosphatase PhoE
VTDPATYPYCGGENLEQVRARVAPVLDRLATSNLGRTIVVVAHNLVNRVYLAQYLGVPIAKARGIHQDHCGLNLFQAGERGVKLITLNAAFHLNGCPV